MVRVAFSAFFFLAACATASVAQVTPGTTGQGEPLPPPVAPTPGAVTPAPPATPPPAPPGAPPAVAPAADAGGDADFNAARRRFEEGDREAARAALEGYIAHHPDHGGRRPAELMLARL
ncbi:MAG TPA: hypothetical protein VHK47_21855, partial [Polyangia bacterium]|nr:hypothetical protein [Polyangia bacterium]